MKVLKKLVPFLALLPFVIGAIGYIIAGECLSDAFYASFALYFINPVSDNYNLLIDVARWTSALVTTTAVLYAVRRIWLAVARFTYCLTKDSIAVYSDDDMKIVFDNPRKKVLYLGREFKSGAKSQIIMLSSDEESLKFYEAHKSELKKSKVYIGLKEIDCTSLRGAPNINFFEIDNAIARTLWKHIALWEQRNNKTEIAILGTNHLGQIVLNCGLLMNLYALDQEITYNFIGENDLYQISHGNIYTFNKDEVHFFKPNDGEVINIVKKSDIVIVSERISVEKMNALSIICGGKVYFYSSDSDMSKYITLPNAEMFGKNSDIYTDENIRQNKLISAAMEQHCDYLSSRPENAGISFDKIEEWNKLSGFLKWSNISSSDFKQVLMSLCKDGIFDEEPLAELEHIRWCRFHILNFWKYGIPQSGAKDTEKRIHMCLCAYSQLKESDKNKNREVVREAQKLSKNR